MITEDTIKFLIENRLRDDREYFHSVRAEYEEKVLNPLCDIVVRLTPTMLSIEGDFIVEPKVSRTISRIYRDTRFSRDKSLFRDVMWVCFQRKRELTGGESAFYFEISPSGFSYGCGYYEAGSEAMGIMRKLIDDKSNCFKRALKAYRSQDVFVLEGDSYKKSKYQGTNAAERDWYDRKSVCLSKHSDDFSLLFSDKLSDTLAEDYLKIKDVYYLFREIEAYKAKND